MPAPLNRQPLGLLDFFGIKNGGEYPLEFGRTVVPEIDALPFYENAGETVYGSTSGNLGAGVVLFGPAGVTTEPGDTWHFRSFGLQFNTTSVGNFAYVRLGAFFGGVFVPWTTVAYGNQALAALPGINALTVQDMYLPPGWSLAYETLGLGGTPPFTAAWMAYRFNW